jgi:large subunit ribosomal protein L23|tara:strand:- start:844 stop:1161 length:318 start_codon:yes stop_codon:yes gene_type:complete
MKNKFKQISLDQAYNIIKKPITTEKSTNLQQFNQYSFIVSKNSNTFEIKKAIEVIFKVKVSKVNTSILRGKGKTFKGQYGFRKDTKRAIVTLIEGNTIDPSLEIK